MGGMRLVALGSTLALFVSCTGADQQAVRTFLTAVQGGDEATLSGISLVKFPGSVTSWEILEFGPESKEPFLLAQLRQEMTALEQQIEISRERHANFLSDNAKKAEEYQKRVRSNPDYQFTGDMADFKTELEARTAKHKELEGKLDELREQMKSLREAAALSLNTVVNDNFEGEVKGKVVRLKIHDGSGEKIYSLILRRFELSDKERNLTPMPRWIVTGVEEQV